jgi:hypothetical protein
MPRLLRLPTIVRASPSVDGENNLRETEAAD